jgi:glutaredoxin
MLKKLVFFIFLGTILLTLAGCQSSDNGKIIFYYSLTCPHCKNVEKYVADNNVKAKVDFIEKEVSENKQNAAEFAAKAAKCGIKPENAGVPLLWDGSTCIVGDEPIISYFFSKINSNANVNSNSNTNSQ